MSWILGCFGKTDANSVNKIKSCYQNSIIKFESDNYYIQAGGNPGNCFSGTDENHHSWLVCGIGIIDKNGLPKLMIESDWREFLSVSNPDIKKLDGHFVALKWTKDKLKIFTDIVGLRDIYVYEDNGGIIFSTKPVVLSQIVNSEIDFIRFGERWLLPNQISKASIFKNLIRIVGGMSVEYFNKKISITEALLDFEKKIENAEEKYKRRLKEIVLAGYNSGVKTSLSLSGGLDSRLLLTFLLLNKKAPFDTHTFGDPESPDSLIAKQICTDENIQHEQLNDPLPDVNESLTLIRDYVAQTLLTGFASSVLHLRHYANLKERSGFIIDGGFGEIWRRELFNKILYSSKELLNNSNIEKLLPSFSVRRADLFEPGIVDQMQKENHRSFEILFNRMPGVREIGVENWLDLFAIKYTLPTFNCLEQSRMDEFVSGIMPFAQPSLLKLLFSISTQKRKNGMMIKNLLKNNFIDLTHYPLIKNNVTYPFFMNSVSSRIYTRIKSKLGVTYKNRQRYLFINNLKEFALDRLASKSVREFEYYNYSQISKNVNAYYDGNETLINEVDWWIAFELLREQIYKN